MGGPMFKKNKYKLIKSSLSKEICELAYDYFCLKKQVAGTLFDTKFISPFETCWGVWSDPQVPDTYSNYGDVLMDTLLLKVKPIVEKNTGLKLTPNYSYARIYKKGDELKRHKDRFSCEISTTLNLGGDCWPIYLEPSGERGMKGVKINLNPGDMLIYKGMDLEHWREPFKGEQCAQVFLHYNKVGSKIAKQNLYDGRPHLGLQQEFKKNER